MIKLKIETLELTKLFKTIEHKTFQKALTKHWKVDGENVTAQSICWLFCWAKTGMNDDNARQKSEEAFDKIFQTITFTDFDRKVPHDWAREARYRTENIEKELDDLLNKKTTSNINDDFVKKVEKALKLTKEERLSRSNKFPEYPTRSDQKTNSFNRNPYVVAEVLERANGKCEFCMQDAPFNKIKDGTPFLEVHHIQTLSDGGKDTIDNAIALCPNCHRGAHFGGFKIKNNND